MKGPEVCHAGVGLVVGCVQMKTVEFQMPIVMVAAFQEVVA